MKTSQLTSLPNGCMPSFVLLRQLRKKSCFNFPSSLYWRDALVYRCMILIQDLGQLVIVTYRHHIDKYGDSRNGVLLLGANLSHSSNPMT